MDYLRFKVEDLIMDESFQQYCSGTDPEVVRFWEEWQRQHPGKKEQIALARTLYLQLNGGLDERVFAAHQQQFHEALQERGILQQGTTEAKVIKHTATRWKWYAAAAVLAGACLLAAFLLNSRRQHGLPAAGGRQYASKAGERKSFQLPDGSKVILNAGSTLMLKDGFNKNTRTLALKGEAFFDVAHNAALPFIVSTEEMDIRVLGTAFNVRAYPDDERNEAALIRGLVEVSLKKGTKGQKLLLKPNEKVVVERKAGLPVAITKIPAPALPAPARIYTIASLTRAPQDSAVVELSWIDNRLIFSDEPFEEIARKLERWYDVEIRFASEEIKRYRFTGNFNKENLQRVLEVMKLSRNFNFRFENEHTIIIDKHNNNQSNLPDK